jgi:hypothetical protein
VVAWVAAVLAGPAVAADDTPQVNAAELGLAASPPPVGPTDVRPALEAFFNACVALRGQWQPVVDWGLSNGFDPFDTTQAGQDEFLSGRNGTAMVRLAPGRIVLAVSDDGQCTVWIEGASGPTVLAAFQRESAKLSREGSRAKRVAERMVSRSGTWRRLVQLRYEPAGEEGVFRVGAVTMINEGQGTQALSFAPWPAEPARGTGP